MSEANQDPAGNLCGGRSSASKVPTLSTARLSRPSEESMEPGKPAKKAGKGAHAGRVAAAHTRRVEARYLGRGAAAAASLPQAFASGSAAGPATPRQTDDVTGVEKGGSAERQDWVHQASGQGQTLCCRK